MLDRIPQEKATLREGLAAQVAEYQQAHTIQVIPFGRESRYLYAVALGDLQAAETDVVLKAPRWYPGIEDVVRDLQGAIKGCRVEQKAAGTEAYRAALEAGKNYDEALTSRKRAQRETIKTQKAIRKQALKAFAQELKSFSAQ
jgi:hypothetical protein